MTPEDTSIISKLIEVISSFTGIPAQAGVDKFLAARGIVSISALDETQKRDLVEGLVEKLVQPRLSLGKTTTNERDYEYDVP